jgi:hypothetical protein
MDGLSFREKVSLTLYPLLLAQPHTWTSDAVLINKNDAGVFQSSANNRVIGRRKRRFPFGELGPADRRHAE